VNCFWVVHRTAPVYEGPEYFVTIGAVDGRTRDESEVIAGVSAWLDGHSGSEALAKAPSLDAGRRALREISGTLDPRLVAQVGEPFPLSDERMWLDEQDRSCEINTAGIASFFYGQEEIAVTRTNAHIADLTRLWLLDRVSIRDLVLRDDVEAMRHAEVLEIDPARWHWIRLRERADDPNDFLGGQATIIHALAESQVARRFFTFSSHTALCFSASSHFPWVNEGLPHVHAIDGQFVVDGVQHDLEDAVAHVESALDASPVVPFFGTKADYLRPLLAARLPRLETRVIQRRGSRQLVIGDGERTYTANVYEPIETVVAAALAFFAS